MGRVAFPRDQQPSDACPWSGAVSEGAHGMALGVWDVHDEGRALFPEVHLCGILALPQLGRVLYAITVSKFL